MKYIGLLLAVHAVFDACDASETSPSALRLDLARSTGSRSQSLRKRRNDGTVLANLDNQYDSVYMVNVTIGTPPQPLTLQLDTGSSDTWLPGANTTVCEANNCTMGSYDMSKSSTAKLAMYDEFSIVYGDQSSAKGSYITDVVHFEGFTIPDVVLGYATELIDNTFGLMGIGFPATEGTDAAHEYFDFPYNLYQAGITNTVAYSLWLNDPDAATGSILFGGIDRAKYHGDLTLLDFWLEDGESSLTRFLVMLSAVKAVSPSGSDALGAQEFPLKVLLDSGSTYSTLPRDLAYEIYDETGAVYDKETDDATVSCSLMNSPGYLSFEFGGDGGAVVNVSMSDLVFLAGTTDDGDDYCEFGILPGKPDDLFILGDSFLRSAYVVYDLINGQAAIAQTKFNVTESEIVTFASLGAKVPHATLAPHSGNGTGANDAVTATATAKGTYAAASGFADINVASDESSPASDMDSASSSTTASGSPESSAPTEESAHLVGPAVGGAAAGVLVLGSAAFLWRALAARRKGTECALEAEKTAKEAPLDEAKVPLVPQDGEYGRLSQIQTAYRDDGMHHV